MKRLHVHITVDDLEASKRFYSAIFGQKPTIVKDDYAKWQVEDPRINLAISPRGIREAGVNHLGIQTETSEELQELQTRMSEADLAMRDETGAHCCYAKSDKHWTSDPSSVVWEMFHTMDQAMTYYGDDHGPASIGKPEPVKRRATGCC